MNGWKLVGRHVFDIWQLQYTEGFFAPDLFHSTSVASWGSTRVSKASKFFKEFNFLGFSHCSQNWSIFKNVQNWAKYWHFGWFFEVFSILAEKQWLKRKKIEFLDKYRFFRHPIWPPSHKTSGDISSFTVCFEFWQQQRPL